MSKKILIVKNITREGPGLLAPLLRARGMQYDITGLDAGDRLRPLENYDAAVVLGGPDSANDNTGKIRNELAAIQMALSLEIPYLGICLGLQLLVKAAGGRVVKSPVKEIGFRDSAGSLYTVCLTPDGRKDPLFESLDDEFKVFQLHGETVELTPGMTLLAAGRHCKNQIVKIGKNAYGIQCHFELTPEMLELWMEEDADLKTLDKEEMKKDFQLQCEEYEKTGLQLLNNFLAIADLV